MRGIRGEDAMNDTGLPKGIEAFFEAMNARDVDAVAACFVDGAVMKDEGRVHVGPADISGWLKTASFERHVVSTPRSWRRDGGVDVVVASIAGNFPGSPIDLSYRFRMTGDRVSGLEIG
jgi:hypothetical protein